VSYSVTNTGTVPLTGCTARILLPQEFDLVGPVEEQDYGTLQPGESLTRWWLITPNAKLTSFGRYDIHFEWSSTGQGTSEGCAHAIEVSMDDPGRILVSPLHLYFEADRNGTLPNVQSFQLWTGGGLSMPWTLQSGEYWLGAQPQAGSMATTVTVQPNTTDLEYGLHGTAIDISAATPASVGVSYLIRGTTGVAQAARPERFTLGPVWPHPVRIGSQAQVRVSAAEGTQVDLRIYDLLGRELGEVFDGPVPASGVIGFAPGEFGLTPGMYVLRSTSGGAVIVSVR
jgi:hypothetical protein